MSCILVRPCCQELSLTSDHETENDMDIRAAIALKKPDTIHSAAWSLIGPFQNFARIPKARISQPLDLIAGLRHSVNRIFFHWSRPKCRFVT